MTTAVLTNGETLWSRPTLDCVTLSNSKSGLRGKRDAEFFSCRSFAVKRVRRGWLEVYRSKVGAPWWECGRTVDAVISAIRAPRRLLIVIGRLSPLVSAVEPMDRLLWAHFDCMTDRRRFGEIQKATSEKLLLNNRRSLFLSMKFKWTPLIAMSLP